jgi:hypothetical protein
MLKRLALVTTLCVVAAVSAGSASADVSTTKNATIVTLVCDGQQYQVATIGNGVFTPGHIIGDTGVFVPTAFNLTFSFTPTGGPTFTETNTSAKARQPANAVTCDIPVELNTFTSDEGTFTFSGTVTGFFAPPR